MYSLPLIKVQIQSYCFVQGGCENFPLTGAGRLSCGPELVAPFGWDCFLLSLHTFPCAERLIGIDIKLFSVHLVA